MTELTNLAPNVAIVLIFIWYLNKRDKAFEKLVQGLTRELAQLARAIRTLETRIRALEKKQ